jgi:hypothetical protein
VRYLAPLASLKDPQLPFLGSYHTSALVRMHILEHSGPVFKLHLEVRLLVLTYSSTIFFIRDSDAFLQPGIFNRTLRCACSCTHTRADIFHKTRMRSFGCTNSSTLALYLNCTWRCAHSCAHT